MGERSFYYWRGEAPARDYLKLVDVAKLETAIRGADLVYLSAISLAVIGEAGPRGADADAGGGRAGVAVAFDTNYRPRLWPGAGGRARAIERDAAASRYLSLSTADVEAFDGGSARTMAEAGGRGRLRGGAARRGPHDPGLCRRRGPMTFSRPSRLHRRGHHGRGRQLQRRATWRPQAGGPTGRNRGASTKARALGRRVVQHPGAIIPAAARCLA